MQGVKNLIAFRKPNLIDFVYENRYPTYLIDLLIL